MSLNVTGRLVSILDTVQVNDKFKKREFVVELTETINGTPYINFGKFQLVQTKCDIIDRYSLDNMVTVHFNIKGTSYQDKKDGQTKYITNLDAWKIEPASGGQQPQQPAQQAPAANYASAPVYQAPPVNSAPATSFGDDDLPF